MIHHYVEKARQDLDMSAVTRVAIDGTSFRRRQDDVTPSCDLGTKRVTFNRFHLAKLLSETIDTVRAYRRRLSFDHIFELPPPEAEEALAR